MSDGSARNTLRVTTCDTHEALAAASALFNQYRHHYGEPPGADERAMIWLTDMVQRNMLTVYTASVDPIGDAGPIGLATGHEIPASLVMGRFWQLRDLYVLPGSRRQGVAAALVCAVREAAVTAGATRLSLATEPDNQAALNLYRKLGFRRSKDWYRSASTSQPKRPGSSRGLLLGLYRGRAGDRDQVILRCFL